jgi:deoxyribodipyrimidine photo-lyase
VVTNVLWLRRDLRVHDHPALDAAAGGAEHLVPLFVLDPRLVRSSRMSPARLSYLCDALADLAGSLRDRGSELVVRRGDPREVIPAVAAEVGAAAVHWSADHTAYAQARDVEVAGALDRAGFPHLAHPGTAIHEPGSVRTGAGEVYRVFTPFHRTWKGQATGEALPAATRLPGPPDVESDPLPSPADLGADLTGISAQRGGESQARARLERFLDERAEDYHERRDLPGVQGTSRLSADLHYGCLSPREAYQRLDRRRTGHDTFGTELAWRDFYLHIMAEWPEVARTEFNEQLRALPWRGDGEDAAAWREGRTG